MLFRDGSFRIVLESESEICTPLDMGVLKGGQSKSFGRIHFEHRAPQVPLVIGDIFGEDSGPRRPTGSDPRPAQLLRLK